MPISGIRHALPAIHKRVVRSLAVPRLPSAFVRPGPLWRLLAGWFVSATFSHLHTFTGPLCRRVASLRVPRTLTPSSVFYTPVRVCVIGTRRRAYRELTHKLHISNVYADFRGVVSLPVISSHRSPRLRCCPACRTLTAKRPCRPLLFRHALCHVLTSPTALRARCPRSFQVAAFWSFPLVCACYVLAWFLCRRVPSPLTVRWSLSELLLPASYFRLFGLSSYGIFAPAILTIPSAPSTRVFTVRGKGLSNTVV